MQPEVVGGIQERVKAFLKQCEEARKPAIDFYVNIVMENITAARLTGLGLSTLFCHGLCVVPPAPPVWNKIY